MKHCCTIALLLCLFLPLTMRAQSAPSLAADRTIAAGVGRIADIAFSPDGRLLAAVGASGGLAVFDTQSGASVRQVSLGEPTARVAFGGQALVAAGTERGGVSALNLLTGQTREMARHARNAVTAIAVASDGSIGASGDNQGDILIWPLEGGQAERLREDTKKDPIVFLAFTSPTTLISVNKALAVTAWDVPKRRSIRRGTLQLESIGREAEFSAASTDANGAQLALASQYLASPRGGLLSSNGPARPGDLKRTNVIVPYGTDNGIAGDPIQLGDFLPERIALSPGSCFAVFSSNYRDQPRLHLWSMVKQGQDLVRTELPGRASGVALDPTGRYVAVALPSGEIRTWRVSGATKSDCDLYRNATNPIAAKPGPKIALGSEGQPLLAGRTGLRLAVMRFEVGGVDDFLGDAVSEMVGGELSNSSGVVVVERAAINAIIKEMQLQASGLTAADAVKVGRGLNVQKVLLGSVRRFGEGTYVITARVVDVETQQVQGNREVTCENCAASDLPAAVRVLRQAIVP